VEEAVPPPTSAVLFRPSVPKQLKDDLLNYESIPAELNGKIMANETEVLSLFEVCNKKQ
jgi:hypothetical protein